MRRVRTAANRAIITTILVGSAILSAAGCSALLGDPGGYYLRNDASPPPEAASEAAPDADTESGDDVAAADESAVEAGPMPEGSTDAGADAPTCFATQIMQPGLNATVSSPVSLVVKWDPCMCRIVCHLDYMSAALATISSSTQANNTTFTTAAGQHYLACETYYDSCNKVFPPSPSETPFIVGGDGG
jgi:hypothetical protein